MEGVKIFTTKSAVNATLSYVLEDIVEIFTLQELPQGVNII